MFVEATTLFNKNNLLGFTDPKQSNTEFMKVIENN
jgi:hypothetical protein